MNLIGQYVMVLADQYPIQKTLLYFVSTWLLEEASGMFFFCSIKELVQYQVVSMATSYPSMAIVLA